MASSPAAATFSASAAFGASSSAGARETAINSAATASVMRIARLLHGSNTGRYDLNRKARRPIHAGRPPAPSSQQMTSRPQRPLQLRQIPPRASLLRVALLGGVLDGGFGRQLHPTAGQQRLAEEELDLPIEASQVL